MDNKHGNYPRKRKFCVIVDCRKEEKKKASCDSSNVDPASRGQEEGVHLRLLERTGPTQ